MTEEAVTVGGGALEVDSTDSLTDELWPSAFEEEERDEGKTEEEQKAEEEGSADSADVPPSQEA